MCFSKSSCHWHKWYMYLTKLICISFNRLFFLSQHFPYSYKCLFLVSRMPFNPKNLFLVNPFAIDPSVYKKDHKLSKLSLFSKDTSWKIAFIRYLQIEIKRKSIHFQVITILVFHLQTKQISNQINYWKERVAIARYK